MSSGETVRYPTGRDSVRNLFRAPTVYTSVYSEQPIASSPVSERLHFLGPFFSLGNLDKSGT
jgi:hypothetical protein